MPADLIPGVDLPAAVLWDLDGTLVDSEASWHRAEARLMAEWGGPVMTPEQHRTLVGMNSPLAVTLMRDWSGVTFDDFDADAWAAVLNQHALDDMATAGLSYRPGAEAMLVAVRAAGMRCGLVSATWSRVLDHVVSLMPPDTFETVVGGDQVSAGKPAPDPYLMAVDQLGLEVRDCLAVEDSLTGTASAERAGLATLGVPFEHPITEGPRRRLVPSLDGLTIAELGRHWRELRDA